MALYDYATMAKKLEFAWLDTEEPAAWGKFIVIFDDTAGVGKVLAGNFEYHNHIPFTKEPAFERNGFASLVGAGKFKSNGVITEWAALAFKLRTPDELRPALETLFEANEALIQERWQKK